MAMPAAGGCRGIVTGVEPRQAPVGQPHQTQPTLGTARPPGEQEPCGKKQEKQVSSSWQRDRPGQKPGGREGLGDGQRGQRRPAQGILLLCGLGAGLMGTVGRRKGVSVTDSLPVSGVQGRLVVREGSFSTLCPHQTLSSQWAHLPILEWGRHEACSELLWLE